MVCVHLHHFAGFRIFQNQAANCGQFELIAIGNLHRDYIMPPTPPPDIDLDAWRVSEDRILSWDPDTLFLTHFGPFHGARVHFQEMTERLEGWSRIVRRLLADASLDDEQRVQAFMNEALLDLKRKVGELEAERYSRAGRLDYSWQGLSRYWKKKMDPSRNN